MQCQYCGNQIDDHAPFCIYCGNTVTRPNAYANQQQTYYTQNQSAQQRPVQYYTTYTPIQPQSSNTSDGQQTVYYTIPQQQATDNTAHQQTATYYTNSQQTQTNYTTQQQAAGTAAQQQYTTANQQASGYGTQTQQNGYYTDTQQQSAYYNYSGTQQQQQQYYDNSASQQPQQQTYDTSTQQQPTVHKTNALAVIGLILAFFVPIAGLISSIIGLLRSKQFDDNDKYCAIAGIIVGAAFLLVQIILMAVYAEPISKFISFITA